MEKGDIMKNKILIALFLIFTSVGGAVLYAAQTDTTVKNEKDSIQNSEDSAIEETLKIPSGEAPSAKVEEKFAQIPHKTATDSISQSDNVLYYFYQPQCPHCIEIEEDIVKYYDNKSDDVEFYAVDLSNSENANVWSKEDFSLVGTEVKKVSDFKVVGTPTMIELNNGEIANVAVGNEEVIDLLKEQ